MDPQLYEPDNPYAHGRLIVLSLLIIMPLICLLPRWIFQYRWDQHVLVQPEALGRKSSLSELVATIPEPRLQSQPQRDLQRFRMQERQKLESYGWEDQTSGRVRVPIHEAMERYLQSSAQP